MDRIDEPKPYFDKRTTNIIKGIALIMMFIHHFYTFPRWWITDVSYPLIEKIAPFICQPFKLCVSIYCFMTGYFYFFNKERSYRYSLKKITDLLVSYWCIFLIFAVLAVLLVDYHYTIKGFIKECFALEHPTMRFCWYVYFYISFMLILPVLTKFMSKNIHLDLVISLLIIPSFLLFMMKYVSKQFLLDILSNLKIWFSSVLIGYIFASYNLFERIGNMNHNLIKNKKTNVLIMLIIAILSPLGRNFEPSINLVFTSLPSIGINMDIVYAPLFIYAIVAICNYFDFKVLKDILFQIGKYSLLMWFISCIFFNNCQKIFQPILYFPHDPLLVTIWGLFICFVISFTLEKIIVKIKNEKNKLFFE